MNEVIGGNHYRPSAIERKRLCQVRGVFLIAFAGLAPIATINYAMSATAEDSPGNPSVAAAPAEAPIDKVSLTSTTTTTTTIQHISVHYSEGVTGFSGLIENSAEQFEVDPCLIGAITERESRGNIYVEYGGAHGLMQINTETALSTARQHEIQYNGDLYNPATQFAIGSAIIANAEAATGIDTNQVLTNNQLATVSTYYHGEGFSQLHMQGKPVPAIVTEANNRLEAIYQENCRQ